MLESGKSRIFNKMNKNNSFLRKNLKLIKNHCDYLHKEEARQKILNAIIEKYEEEIEE